MSSLGPEMQRLSRSELVRCQVSQGRWLLNTSQGNCDICMDPRDLNRANKRKHYQMPTIKDITTRRSIALVFTVVDAKSEFWQATLDEEPSQLTTFNTSFGRYMWKREPFGISSAPKVWQRKMHETIEGLEGTDIIADEAEHDVNLHAFLERCRERNLILNPEKVH